MSVHRTMMTRWEAMCGATAQTDPAFEVSPLFAAVDCPKCRPTFWGGKP
jgi:hypothetical protein